MQTVFKKLKYVSLVESTKIDNITFPYKTSLSEANVKAKRMWNTKLTYRKERTSFACNHFPFSKLLLQFRNLIYTSLSTNRVKLWIMKLGFWRMVLTKVLALANILSDCKHPMQTFK